MDFSFSFGIQTLYVRAMHAQMNYEKKTDPIDIQVARVTLITQTDETGAKFLTFPWKPDTESTRSDGLK